LAPRGGSVTFFCCCYKHDSIAALSPAAATRPIDPVRPFAFNTARKFLERNCLGSTGGSNTRLLKQE
jgi:hypothetical protein